MTERPIILFGTPGIAQRTSRGPAISNIKLPAHSRQSARLVPKMAALQSTLITLQQTAVGIEPEKVLVFELAKDIKAFYTAIKHLGDGIELIFDAPDDISVTDDFYITEINSQTGETIRRNDKYSFGGKIYCVLTNAQALQEILNLWERYTQDSQTQFPRGKTGLKNVFDCLVDIHTWGYKERIEETGILDAWNEDLQNPDLGSVRCEIELFFRQSPNIRQQREDDLAAKISALGGAVLGRSIIADIAYHAVLADLPRNAVEQIIRNDSSISLLSAEQIMFFKPTGQAVFLSEGSEIEHTFNLPKTETIIDEPIIALFDGLPQENHPFLINRLIIDDPDDYSSQYTVADRKHGTSMASLITLGDLSGTLWQSTHKIYVRPIMKPNRGFRGTIEEIPDNVLLADKIHEAVRRLFVAEADFNAVAPSIKVINLSIGIAYRQFDRSMSPLARLLDWLSYKYRVLFIVSSGNHSKDLDIGMSFTDFMSLDFANRDKEIITWIYENARNLRLLSPSESINALTVGATFDDESVFNENARQILPCSNGIISPTSALGKGLNNSVKPDIIFPGGRKSVIASPRNSEVMAWSISQRELGTQSAAPFTPGSATKTVYTFGTSNAASLISHEASRCYDALIEGV